MAYEMKNGPNRRPQEEAARLMSLLEAERTDFFEEIAGFLSSGSRQSKGDLKELVQSACQHMEAISDSACTAISKLADKQSDASKALRKFLMDNGMDRLPRKPDIFKTIAIVQICGLAEGALTAGQYIADGKFGLMSSVAVAAMIAATNITAGLSIGYFSRYINFRTSASEPKSEDRKIRLAAKFGAGVSTLGLGLLHYGAARVRLTGELGHLFDFSEVSFGATFANYDGLTLLAFGTIGAVVAIYKGRHDLSDPVVGATEARTTAEDTILSSLESLHDGAAERLDGTFDNACDTVEAHIETLTSDREHQTHTLISLMGRLSHFNNSVHRAVSDLKILQADDLKRREYLADKVLEPVFINFDAFENLLIDPAIMPPSTDLEAQSIPAAAIFISRLELAHSAALARIDDAYQEIENFVHNLPILD